MPKDYKDRVPGTLARVSRRRRRRGPWLWAVPAILAALAVVVVFSFTDKEETAAAVDAETATNGEDVAQPPDEATQPGVLAHAKTTVVVAEEKKSTAIGKQGKKGSSAEKVPEIALPEPRFTFYKILPEKEVLVSESEIRSLARDEKAGKKAGEVASYVVQAGSYASLGEAEKMKAVLAGAKVKAKMEKVIIEGAVWYRVKVGPYNSLTEAERMRAYLRKNKIDSVLQQTKP